MATQKTEAFDNWIARLRDGAARVKILGRIRRLEDGNLGKVSSVGDGISEMKIDFGPGYRVYFKRSGRAIYVLLCGGDKSTQATDIKRAKKLAKDLDI